MNPGGKLRLVPYDPSDYSLGNVLYSEDASVMCGLSDIASTLSMYFQWPDYGFCTIVAGSGEMVRSVVCRMDYDRDEITPSEIRIRFQDRSDIGFFKVFDSCVIRFEVFRICYEFKTAILAVAESGDSEQWDMICEPPSQLSVRKTRRLPRTSLDQATVKLAGAVGWKADGGDFVGIELIEIGMSSIKARSIEGLVSTRGVISFSGLEIAADVARSSESFVVFVFKFKDAKEHGAFFDFYRRLVYPSLRSRYEYSFDTGLGLYSDSNYFGKYEGEKSDDQKSDIARTWEDIRDGVHLTNCDLYIVDKELKPTGCSGVALACSSADVAIWSFHQLCALRRPELVEQSGVLYTWRAEYLAGKPDKVVAVGCFSSKSRWLERIYVKHASNCQKTTKLVATKNMRCTFSAADATHKLDGKSFLLGRSRRFSFMAGNTWGAIGPRYLNANSNLDTIVSVFEVRSAEELTYYGASLVKEAGMAAASVLVTANPESDLSALGGSPQLSDRYFEIPKGDLVSLIAAVEHSVAVTARKLTDGIVA